MTALETEPPSAMMTEFVDPHAGVVRASGVLTRSGADLLCGTVESLERLGHRSVVVDLSGLLGVEDEGLAHFEELCVTTARQRGLALVVRRPSWRSS
jgi:hypothetical protein